MNYTVIIADDEPYILQGLEKRVDWNGLGYTIVGKASSGTECLELVRSLDPDLVITDIRMPGLNGIELLENIRRVNSRTVVIYISGYAEFEYAHRAIELGVLSYILKPIEKKELAAALEKARQQIESRQKEIRKEKLRAAEETLEFLMDIPPGTDSGIILSRIGLSGRYDTYLCLVEEHTDADSGAAAICREVGEISVLTPGLTRSYGIINVPSDSVTLLIRKLYRLFEAKKRSAGISRADVTVQLLPELIRQAKNFSYSSFITGNPALYTADDFKEPVLARITGDFGLLFSVGNESRIHHMIDELRNLNGTPYPSIQEVLGFYNGFMEMCAAYASARNTPFYTAAPMTDAEELVRRFAGIRTMIEHLHGVVRGVFEATDRGSFVRGSATDTITKIRQYVRNNLDADINADTIADIFQVEKSYLFSLFKSETGKTLIEFIREIRIDHACFLLKHTRLGIQGIADMCGFSDYFYFARLFRREKGMTASEYRRKHTAVR